MNIFLALLIFASVLHAGMAVGAEAYALITAECLKNHYVDKESIDKYNNGELEESKITHNIKCYIQCTMVKQGNMSEKGVFQAEQAIINLLQFVHVKPFEDLVKNAVNHCKDVKGSDGCETAYNISKCIGDYETQHFKDNPSK